MRIWFWGGGSGSCLHNFGAALVITHKIAGCVPWRPYLRNAEFLHLLSIEADVKIKNLLRENKKVGVDLIKIFMR